MQPGRTMASWSRSRGASSAWGQVPNIGLLNTFSLLEGNLQRLADYSGLRHAHYRLDAIQQVRGSWQHLIQQAVQPDEADTLLDLLLAAQTVLQARSPDGQMPGGVRIEVTLQGQPPHPPAPHPTRPRLGGRR